MNRNEISSRSNRSGRRNNKTHGKGNNGNGRHNNGGGKNKGYDGNKPWLDTRNAPVVNRSLFASAMGADGYTTVVRVLSDRQIGRIILDGQINVIDLSTIEGFADKAKLLGVDGMVALVLGETGKIAQQYMIALNVEGGIEGFKAALATAVRKLYNTKHECSVGEILTSLRGVNCVQYHGSWDGTKVAARRFIASVLFLAYGADWIKANFSSKPVGYKAISVYKAETIAANGFEAHNTIPTLTPVQTLVFGVFPSANGKVDMRYVGTLPAKPMVGSVNPNTILPAFIVVDRTGESMKQLIKLVETGWMDANDMFKTEKGEYFTYSPEIVAIMRSNQLLFTTLLSMAIACTNGNVPLATAIKERYDAFARAYPGLTSLIAQDYTMTKALPTVTATSRTFIPSGTNGSTLRSSGKKTVTPVLEPVGAGASSSFDPFAANS